MIKLIALYATPEDSTEFDRHYTVVHLPLIRQLPGLLKAETTRVTGMPIGDKRFYLLTELYFDTEETMQAALASKTGKTLAHDLTAFGGQTVTVFSGEVV